jgi:hypothetical protein
MSGACGGRPAVRFADARAGGDGATAGGAEDAGIPDALSLPDGSLPDSASVDVSQGPDVADASGESTSPAMLSLAPAKATITGVVGAECPPDMPLALLVRNVGGEPTGPIEASVAGSRAFSLETRCGSLRPLETCTVAVSFRAEVAGPQEAAVTVKASPGGQASAAITGVAGYAEGADISPATGMFAPVTVGAASPPVTFTVTNAGGFRAPGPIKATVSSNEFVIDRNECESGLDPGKSCAIAVHLQPLSPGAKSAILTVTLRGCSGGSATASLQGLALSSAAALAFSPPAGVFGVSCVGERSHVVPLRAANVAASPTGLLRAKVEGENAAEFLIVNDTCSGRMLAPVETCTVEVVSLPSSRGTKQGILKVEGPDLASVQTPLSATARIIESGSVSPLVVGFARVSLNNRSPPATITVSNPGTQPSPPISATVTGSHPRDFEITGDTCAGKPVPAGGSCSVTVAFVPTVIGDRAALLTFSPAMVECTRIGPTSLSGTGLAP